MMGRLCFLNHTHTHTFVFLGILIKNVYNLQLEDDKHICLCYSVCRGGLHNLDNKLTRVFHTLELANILCGWRLNDNGHAITVGGHKPKLGNDIDKDRIA